MTTKNNLLSQVKLGPAICCIYSRYDSFVWCPHVLW